MPFYSVFSWKNSCCHLLAIFCKKPSILWKTHSSHAHNLSKKLPFSQNTMLSCHFFILKTPCFHAQDQSKKVNSVKPTLYYGPKKWIGFPYFPNFHEKITALKPIFGQKTSTLKSKQHSCPYFVKKTSILSKTWCSPVLFF